MPPKQPASSSKDPLTKTGPSPRRQKQNREAQKRYREKRNQLHRDLERRYAELTTCSKSCTIGEAESPEEGPCNEYEQQHLAELQAENMSLTAMIKQRDLFEASALTAAEQVNCTHHHTITITPAAEPQNQQDPHNPQQSEYVASDDIVWDELLNFSDTSDFETDEVSSSAGLLLMQQDIEITKSSLSKVPSLSESSDLIDQFASLVMQADVRISKVCITTNIPT
ncbi:hypothetical protein BCR33DRAFT_75198 [Rhizoclosmatium globosum]|uniref:BZIP domain-containing protein n=1 Tax=Rhizoclosmatium globosum TaxID=329046 RepID=A0A1Y2AU71_9FUNG|nr:hypothetical protein BCR33DRAFT_75198 [Rhizoclosmatium globosum]|eukprot:ORY25485.1 hypothetical protein BCR33DRAFT_75198 [Rhizoclosmatium globosum]